MPTISIIIPTHNRAYSLKRLLDSLQGQLSTDVNIIVVDDYSNDHTGRVLEQYRSLIASKRMVGRSGPARARNAGFGESSGEWLLFVDDDCVAPANWLHRWSEVIDEANNDIGAIGGAILPLGQIKPKHLSAHWYLNLVEHMNGPVLVNDQIVCLPSANLAVRREAFAKIGGFDETFIAPGGEDSDLTYRICSGWKVKYSSVAAIYHDHGVSQVELFRKYTNYGRGVAQHIRRRGRQLSEGMLICESKWGVVVGLYSQVRKSFRFAQESAARGTLETGAVAYYRLLTSIAYQLGGAIYFCKHEEKL